ncbi:hypothetical protein [Pseudaminobacter soli (ex Li et al. 2025)]|uniref:Curlin n=1 Tax=Pseudaminobacter soli (ex Li et al. 2025) TaxID=1295366 RepID=A0A2P7SE83_9HYPH|nr:hypothetical protein [Mesorhizobium soli]PSJ60809.1 hypothetical protein C7I85_12265 [Mesorhizobium soli]
MKHILTSFAFVLSFSSASIASPLDLSSSVYINQLDGAGFSKMDTAAIVAPLMQIAQQLPQLNPGPSNLALVWQEGEFNNASVDQQGSSNVGLIRQIGYNNNAAIHQVGNGHQAMIFQQGRNNTAIISQR